MDSPQIGRELGYLKQLAGELRREATPAEAVVWGLLRGRKLNGFRFRRQHVLHGYILDFYCHEMRLCIELDGAPHLDPGQAAKDEQRDADLRVRGYKVLRAWNVDVLSDLPAFRDRVLALASVPPL